MVSSQSSRDRGTNEQAARMQQMQTVFDKSPVGLLLLDQDRVSLANPAALKLLNQGTAEPNQVLRIDGPDGLLVERLTEAARTNDIPSFDYRMPQLHGDEAVTLRFEVVPIKEGSSLVRIDDVTADHDVQLRWEEAVSNAFHELRTPLAVFSLGLSNLSTYYERFSDEQRRSMIDELAAEGDEMSKALSILFGQMRNIQRSTVHSNPQDS